MSSNAPPTRLGMLGTLRSLLGGPGHRGPKTDHFDGVRFFNPVGSTGRSFAEVRRWRRTSQPKAWPQWVENRARPAPATQLAAGEIALTFVNHITFLVQFRGLNVLTDPVYSQRVSPFTSVGPKRVRDPGLRFEELPRIDLVLVTHNHYDHLDMPTLVRLQRTHSPCFVTSLGNKPLLESFGLENVHELDWWQQINLPNARVTMTPARHWSARSPRNRNRTLWGGFVVDADDRRLFFAGDTGYGSHFRDVRERCGPLDLCLLPIGAYEPRWFMEEQHMNPDDAVRAHLDLGTPLSVGTHFGCFRLTDEGIDDPVVDLATARRKYGVAPEAFQVLETGETRMMVMPITSRDLVDTPN